MSKAQTNEATIPLERKDRASIEEYPKESLFRPGDIVYIDVANSRGLEGPYLIARAVPNEVGKYFLCNEEGEPVKGGQEIDEKDLRLHKWGNQTAGSVG